MVHTTGNRKSFSALAFAMLHIYKSALGNTALSVQLEKEKESKGEEAAGPDAFDSNCITPGTPFMQRLGEHLRYFIRRKISEDPAWQVPVIVFSGAQSSHALQPAINAYSLGAMGRPLRGTAHGSLCHSQR